MAISRALIVSVFLIISLSIKLEGHGAIDTSANLKVKPYP